MSATTQSISIDVGDNGTVSALLQSPPQARICYVMAHGAGAGMTHPFMQNLADALSVRGVATLRYQFPYMERDAKRPDGPAVAQATVRAAASHAAQLLPKCVLVAGGKSFGGRMTSQAQAALPLAGVAGLVFVGFPLHPAGQPSVRRADHLASVRIPMLFVQGTRDRLAELTLLQPVLTKLGDRATLSPVVGADHSFHLIASTGRRDSDALAEIAQAIAIWSADIALPDA
jgi:predicted alpha/beta-hydrolase family hydrolase